jgi:hypothetical protein
MAKGKTNTWLSYELLLQAIFQAINDQEEVANLIVERERTLQGKTTPHQIYCRLLPTRQIANLLLGKRIVGRGGGNANRKGPKSRMFLFLFFA